MKITDDIKYIGVDDHDIDLFEGQYDVPEGMAYNSYIIIDDKIAVMDSVDGNFTAEWMDNIADALGEREPDYLVVHHMEPDHSGGIQTFMDKYTGAKIVSGKAAFNMMKNFFGTDYADRQVVVSEGSTFGLGSHELQFISAPMVHWPEVIMSYDTRDKVLFSADAFGKFGANDEDDEEGWACEARRYYFGIVGKFGQQVQALLKKVSVLDISVICPLHGPVLNENLGYYLDLYDKWSAYNAEDSGVTIAYTSVYGNTKMAAMMLHDMLKDKGVEHIEIFDLARDDMAEAVEAAFRYDRIVLATTTYNGDIFPFMKNFIDHLKDHNYCGRKIALIENGAWAPMAVKKMKEYMEGMKDITFCDTVVKITGSLNEVSKSQISTLVDELAGRQG
ncbi:MAG: MBL fold metallo-hydrolase [Lachnospiraceae bacterium]|nr:MBL fold metallo-hydrolase [Lachnospiraceae bacterium]